MRVSIAAAAFVIFGSGALAQSPADAPTEQEIATAYRSKSGLFQGTPLERWRSKKIREWKVHFKRVGEEKQVGVRIFKYEAVAERNNICGAYQITEVQVLASPNAQIKPSLFVETSGTRSCR